MTDGSTLKPITYVTTYAYESTYRNLNTKPYRCACAHSFRNAQAATANNDFAQSCILHAFCVHAGACPAAFVAV